MPERFDPSPPIVRACAGFHGDSAFIKRSEKINDAVPVQVLVHYALAVLVHAVDTKNVLSWDGLLRKVVQFTYAYPILPDLKWKPCPHSLSKVRFSRMNQKDSKNEVAKFGRQ